MFQIESRDNASCGPNLFDCLFNVLLFYFLSFVYRLQWVPQAMIIQMTLELKVHFVWSSVPHKLRSHTVTFSRKQELAWVLEPQGMCKRVIITRLLFWTAHQSAHHSQHSAHLQVVFYFICTYRIFQVIRHIGVYVAPYYSRNKSNWYNTHAYTCTIGVLVACWI